MLLFLLLPAFRLLHCQLFAVNLLFYSSVLLVEPMHVLAHFFCLVMLLRPVIVVGRYRVLLAAAQLHAQRAICYVRLGTLLDRTFFCDLILPMQFQLSIFDGRRYAAEPVKCEQADILQPLLVYVGACVLLHKLLLCFGGHEMVGRAFSSRYLLLDGLKLTNPVPA